MKTVRAPESGQTRDITRDRVARMILESGQISASDLAEQLGLTAAAVRRHLDTLEAEGYIESKFPRTYGPRGRGRPNRVFEVTPKGRDNFEQAYDRLAVDALNFLAATAGPDAITAFAEARISDLEDRLRESVRANPDGDRVRALADAMTSEGFLATAHPSPLGGDQLCQHHCPVAHVAEEFPQLCEAETAALSRVLGTHVQRLATIAHGDGVCTTHIPHAVPAPAVPARPAAVGSAATEPDSRMSTTAQPSLVERPERTTS